VSIETGSADLPPAGRPGVAARLLLLTVSAYRLLLSPVLGGFCRFEPTCSRYAEQALLRHGARRGLRLTAGRLMRCQPFHPGGFDPVP
jgi:putative membrane protein insertion efficiency factor